jgi:tRNA(His) guanylyltransferase
MEDSLGDRMKAYEKQYTSEKFRKDQPLVLRFDGRSFSKFTKSFDRPFDQRITDAMVAASKALISETNAKVVYTQSDEITAVYPSFVNPLSDREFAGKQHKIISVYASIVTAHFSKAISVYTDKLAYFDCRGFNVPDEGEAINAVIWRIQDARRNAVSSSYRWTLGHKIMQGKSCEQMKRELGEVYTKLPQQFKYGTMITKNGKICLDNFSKMPFSEKVTCIFGEEQ